MWEVPGIIQKNIAPHRPIGSSTLRSYGQIGVGVALEEACHSGDRLPRGSSYAYCG